ncbi:MAG: Hsp20/alpha crystallin family protein [Dongiaceae bacterium]
MARNWMNPYAGGGLLGGGDPFLSLHREINRMVDDVFRGAGLPAGRGEGQGAGGAPVNAHMDVAETEKELRITAELPGVSEQDVEVTLEDDLLTIRGEKKHERKDEQENYHFVERSYGRFQRSLRLPFPAEPDQVQARFDNGVLTVTVPKSERQQRSRRIQVQGGQVQGGAGQGGQAAQIEGGSGQGTQSQGQGKPSGGGSGAKSS